MTELPVQIASDLPGAITALDGLLVTLRSPKAFPPGQPLAFVLVDPTVRLEARSIGTKRAADGGAFEVRVRLINLRKEAREALESAWARVERG